MDVLVKLGLTENEAKVYMGLCQYPNSTAAGIARKLNMDKSSTYRAMDELERQGLAVPNPTEDGTLFTPLNPQKLELLLEKKRDELKRQEDELKTLIDELVLRSKSSSSTYIKTYSGINAHIDMMEKSLEVVDKIIYEKWYMDNPIFRDEDYQKYVYNFVKKRVRKKIELKYLVDSKGVRGFDDIMRTSKKLFKEVRINPKDADIIHSYRIFDDTTEIVTFDKNEDVIVIEINDKLVTELMLSQFKFIWNSSQKI